MKKKPHYRKNLVDENRDKHTEITLEEYNAHILSENQTAYMCRTCGKLHVITHDKQPPSTYKVPMYCSNECMHDYRNGYSKELSVSCLRCNKMFQARYNLGKYLGIPRYCSRKCHISLKPRTENPLLNKENKKIARNIQKRAPKPVRLIRSDGMPDRLASLRPLAAQLTGCLLCKEPKKNEALFCSVACANKGRTMIFLPGSDEINQEVIRKMIKKQKLLKYLPTKEEAPSKPVKQVPDEPKITPSFMVKYLLVTLLFNAVMIYVGNMWITYKANQQRESVQ